MMIYNRKIKITIITKPIDKKHTPKEFISIDLMKYLKFDYDMPVKGKSLEIYSKGLY